MSERKFGDDFAFGHMALFDSFFPRPRREDSPLRRFRYSRMQGSAVRCPPLTLQVSWSGGTSHGVILLPFVVLSEPRAYHSRTGEVNGVLLCSDRNRRETRHSH